MDLLAHVDDVYDHHRRDRDFHRDDGGCGDGDCGRWDRREGRDRDHEW